MIPHWLNINATTSDMDMPKMCAYPPSQHALLHCKFVLCCCYNSPRIDFPNQESDRHHSNLSPSICFHIYHSMISFIVHGKHPWDETNNLLFGFKKSGFFATCKNIHQKSDCYDGYIY